VRADECAAIGTVVGMDDNLFARPHRDDLDQPEAADPLLVVRLDDPASMVEAVPHLIGFVPDDSLIAILFTTDPSSGRSRSVGTVRLDLLPADHVADAITATIIPVLSERSVDCVALLAWVKDRAPDAPGGPSGMEEAVVRHGTLLLHARSCFEANGIAVRDALVVAGDRFTSTLCDDRSCCPRQGRPWSAAGSSRISAESVFAGLPAPLADREVLRERLEADDVLVAGVERARTERGGPWAPELGGPGPFDGCVIADAVHAFGRTGRLTLLERTRVLEVLLLGGEREAAVRLLLDAGPGQAQAKGPAKSLPQPPPLSAQQRLWELLCRSASDELAPAPAALVALAAALCGEGAMANLAVDRAQEALRRWCDQDDRAADHPHAVLVSNTAALVGAGLPPERVRALLETVYLRADRDRGSGTTTGGRAASSRAALRRDAAG
jgi:hypothetical protein